MNTLQVSTKDELIAAMEKVSSLLDTAKSIPGMADHSFDKWEKIITGISQQIPEEIIKVAVVGSIKSGKSTFVNSFLEHDYLKRGAGVVTSIVTRVRGGSALRAKLFFKSWDVINTEINNAMVLFPSSTRHSRDNHYDLRRKQDRQDLEAALSELSNEQIISHGKRNADSVLLTLYLKGYDHAHRIVDSDTTTRIFENNAFADHRTFVGNDALAVYLRDIQLEVGTQNLDSNLEIADCQGVDSLNPLHLTMIQDYLIKTHLIIYVISSRTGLREADVRFLSMIKKMGIMDNIIFIINCDFSEHGSIQDLNDLVEKSKEDLAFFKDSPEVFSFSSLFNLFKYHAADLPEKDRYRYEQWGKESEFVALSDGNTALFQRFFHEKVTRDRYVLLYKNHLERLSLVLAGIGQWIYISQDLLSRNSRDARDVLDKITFQREKIEQLKSTVANTLNGISTKIKNELKNDVDGFFDPRSGRLIRNLILFVRTYRVSIRDYEEDLVSTGFSNTLYLVFQAFKHTVDTFMAEKLNPEIVAYVKDKERKIVRDLFTIASPFDIIVREACTAYKSAMGLGVSSFEDTVTKIEMPDLNTMKNAGGLTFPPAVATLQYSAGIKADAVLHFGFYSIVKRIKKMLKRVPDDPREDAARALKIGISRMKRETEKSFLILFMDYKESLKYQYIFKLVDAVSNTLNNQLLERFHACVTDLSKVSDMIGDNQRDKGKIIEILTRMDHSFQSAGIRIKQIREKIAPV